MIITQTPLRISFAGGGTDLPGYTQRRDGFAVNAAIDKAVFVIVHERCDRRISINHSQKEVVDHIDEIQHELVRETMRLTGLREGIEVTMLSDVPGEGSGLGSSSSFAVGLLNAFHTLRGERAGAAQLAAEASDIEIRHCHKPIGRQDQYSAAYGGIMALGFRADGSVETERLTLSDAGMEELWDNLFLYYTNQTRKAAEILAHLQSEMPAHWSAMDRIRELAFEVRDAFLRGDPDRVGVALDEHWRLKRGLSACITNDTIDEMYDKAREGGATGAKLCGAGGGGFLLVYAPREAHGSLRHAMEEYRQMPFRMEPVGSRVIFNDNRPSWKLQPPTALPGKVGVVPLR